MHGDMDCFYIQGVSGLLAQPSGGGVLRQAGELLFLVLEENLGIARRKIWNYHCFLFVCLFVRNQTQLDIGNSKLSKFTSILNSGKFGYSKKETGKRDEIGNCFEQEMNDNQKDEVICEGSKNMKWSASDMLQASCHH